MRGFAIVAAILCSCSFEGGSAVPDATPVIDIDAGTQPACVTDNRYQLTAAGRFRIEDNQQLSWPDAHASCLADGADLAVLRTDDERGVADELAQASHTWIGLIGETRVQWKWVDGASVEVAIGEGGWASNKPDRGPPQQGCARLNEQGEFDDEPCENTESFLCQCPL